MGLDLDNGLWVIILWIIINSLLDNVKPLYNTVI